eukprot:22225-Eustigmatos_ZCMA.PRE.1
MDASSSTAGPIASTGGPRPLNHLHEACKAPGRLKAFLGPLANDKPALNKALQHHETAFKEVSGGS